MEHFCGGRVQERPASSVEPGGGRCQFPVFRVQLKPDRAAEVPRTRIESSRAIVGAHAIDEGELRDQMRTEARAEVLDASQTQVVEAEVFQGVGNDTLKCRRRNVKKECVAAQLHRSLRLLSLVVGVSMGVSKTRDGQPPPGFGESYETAANRRGKDPAIHQ